MTPAETTASVRAMRNKLLASTLFLAALSPFTAVMAQTADPAVLTPERVFAAVRAEVIELQRTRGTQLNREEIAGLIENRLGRLAWERPQGILQPYATGLQTSYDTMIPANQREYRTRARERLGRNPTEAEIYNEYITTRIRGR